MLRLPTWLSTALIVIVALVWAGTFTAGIFVKNYQPPESINIVFSAIMTTLVLGRGGQKDSSPDHPRPKPPPKLPEKPHPRPGPRP